MDREGYDEENKVIPPVSLQTCDPLSSRNENKDSEQPSNANDPSAQVLEKDAPDNEIEDRKTVNIFAKDVLKSSSERSEADMPEVQKNEHKNRNILEETNLDTNSTKELEEETVDFQRKEQFESPSAIKPLETVAKGDGIKSEKRSDELKEGERYDANSRKTNKNVEEVSHEEEDEPVFDGTEVPGMEANGSLSLESAWPEKAVAFTNFVRQKSLAAVSTIFRRLSTKSDSGLEVPDEDNSYSKENHSKADKDTLPESERQEISEKSAERSIWNPLSLIGISRNGGGENKSEQEDSVEELTQPIAMKGQIILYTSLGCQECKEARKFLHNKRLRYVEINTDIYPTRKMELEKIAGSFAVPRIFCNEVLIGGLNELKILEESGKLGEKIEFVVSETPSYEAPLPPLSGEDDPSSSGAIDELALIAKKMKGAISVKDRFYKIRKFTNCFLGSEAVDFLSEDQYLEREEAVEFGRKLANKLFFQHIEDNIFEDGNHLYRFLDDDPLISQCQNIPKGISEAKPKPIAEISSRLKFLFYAILEAYASEDGKHVDYRSIHGSEEFARYLRIVEELQRVELFEMPREEKLSFFINLYNMMAIHATLVWGHPCRALERRNFFGDFKYVIGGLTYSLSAIQNGILRGNQRPPYNLIKPFGVKDRRLQVALPHVEPLVHFALVCGTRSGPALRCYSPGNIDKELIDAACNFLRTGGISVDSIANVTYVSKILKWYSVDFGKNEVEVLKHAANYLEPADSQAFLELLSNTQLKVIYQPYDWGLNH